MIDLMNKMKKKDWIDLHSHTKIYRFTSEIFSKIFLIKVRNTRLICWISQKRDLLKLSKDIRLCPIKNTY